jgi:outer membrane protein assembly factor BamB
MITRTSFWILTTCLLAAGSLRADEWPQWRGPMRDGVWRETGIVEKFDGPEIRRRWTAPIGAGYSGPTVADGRVYVSDRIEEPAERERVHCFDWTDGKRLWSHEYDCLYTISFKAGPRASISLDDGRAYALGSMGHLHCFDAADGRVLWKKSPEEMNTKVPIWGIAGAPIVEGDLLIVLAGGEDGAVLAFDKRTGQRRWTACADGLSYAAPNIIDQAGRRVLVCWLATRIVGLDPANGELLWEYPFTVRRWVDQILTPERNGNRMFFSCFGDGALMLRLNDERPAVEALWRRFGADEKNTDALHIMMGNPVVTPDHVYGVDAYGEFRCIRADDGERVWEDKTVTSQVRWGSAHMVRQGERVWVFNDRGELIIARLSPKGFETLSAAKLLSPTKEQLNRREGVTWSHPAFAYKHVFNRNDEELVCASLAAE